LKNHQFNYYSTITDASTKALEKNCIHYLAMLFDGHFEDFETDVWEDKNTLEEVFQSMKDDGELDFENVELSGPFHVLFIGYDGTKTNVLQHLEFEAGDQVTLTTSEPDTPFVNCENMLLVVNDPTKNKYKYYLENEFEEIGDWCKKEAYDAVKKTTGLDPSDENVILVSVSS
jgi:hypothetical protein